MNKRKFRKETIEQNKKRLKHDKEFMQIRKEELFYTAKRVDHEVGKYPLHVLKTLVKDIMKELKEEEEE